MKLKSLIAAILYAATSPVLAFEENSPLEILIVTGTRTAQPLKQSLTHATVITEQDIQSSQAADVPNLLKNLAGIEFYQSGGIGKQSSLFMRGTESDHVLILVDGVRINSATAGTTAIDQLMLDQVERIEVVRGNVSSLYGSEAIGGVIQIFTKRGKGKPEFNVSRGMGSQGTHRGTVGFGGELGQAEFNLRASKYKTDGVSAINSDLVPTVNTDKDGYDNTSLSANTRYAFNADHSVSVSALDSRGEAQTDNAFGLSTDDNSSETHIRKFSLVSDNSLGQKWHSKVHLSQGMDKTQNFLNGSPDLAGGALFKTIGKQIGWQNTLRWTTQHTANLGLEHLVQHVASDTAYSKTERKVNSLFAGYIGNHDAHQMQYNLRQDRYTDFGSANTGLLGYGYIINSAWRATASVGTAFKAPTMNDLYYPYTDFGFGFTYQGNPNLKPERSKNAELGVHYAAHDQSIDATYFDNRIRDMIVSNGQMAGTVINLAQARSAGYELAYAGQFENTGVRVNLTRQNPRDTTTGETLLRRAKSYASTGVIQQMGAWHAGGEIQYSGKRLDVDINTYARTTLPSYTLLNLTASYTLSKQFKLSLRVDNVLDKDYMLAHGYNTLGRSLFATLHFKQ